MHKNPEAAEKKMKSDKKTNFRDKNHAKVHQMWKDLGNLA